MLPEKVFDLFLKSLTLRDPGDRQYHDSREVIPSSKVTDGYQNISEPAVRIWYRTDLDITFDRVIERLKGEFSRLGHKSSDAIIGAFIVLYALHPDQQTRPTDVLNVFLSKIVDASLAQFFVLPYPPYPGFKNFRMGMFAIGELNTWSLRKRSRNAGSDFFDRYEATLAGKFALEQHAIAVKVVNLMALLGDYRLEAAGTERIWNRSVEAFFGGLAEEYFDGFWDSLLEAQHLLIACGAPHLDEKSLRDMQLSQRISIFFDIDQSWGHVYPGYSRGMAIDFASADRRIPATMLKLRDDFGIDACGMLVAPLKNYVLFLSKAKRYSNDGLANESFLHYVIALELLFGDRQRAAESVSRRVAILISYSLGILLTEAERRASKLYDARSKYVHKGLPIDPQLLIEAKEVCDEVLWALLRRLQPRSASLDLLDEWTKDLDYLYSAVAAGKKISEEELLASGISFTSLLPTDKIQ
jgi:hypothetical protein